MRHAVLAAVVLAALPAAAAAAARQKLAVTEVKSVQGVGKGTATILSDIVVSEAARAGYDVISQADISAMIGFEKQKKMLGCEETSCLAEIGGALGVDFMLTGQVGQIGTRYRISLLLVDTRKARVLARAAQFCDQNEDALARAAESTVAQVLAAAKGEVPLPPPPAAAVARPAAPPPSLATPRPEPKPAAVPLAEPARPAPAARPAGAGRTAAIVTTAAGGALLVAGAAAGLVARSRYADLDSLQGSPGYLEAWQSKQAGIRSMAVTADVLLGVGAVTAGVGGWLWWRSGRAEVSVAPLISPDGAGLVAAARF